MTSYLLVEQVFRFDFDLEKVALEGRLDLAIGAHNVPISLLLLGHVLLFVEQGMPA